MQNFDIEMLPQLASVPAAHGALSQDAQAGGTTLFDIIITVVLITES